MGISLLLLVCSCTNGSSASSTTTAVERTDMPAEAPADLPRLTQALGVDLEHTVTGSGATVLTPKAGMRRYAQVCSADECPTEVNYRLEPLVLIDFQDLYVIDPVEVTITNRADVVKWWEFSIRPEMEPGQHCVLTVNRWLPQGPLAEGEAAGVAGRSDLIGAGTSPNHCTTGGLAEFEAEFQRTDTADCQSLPRVSLVFDGKRAGDDEMFVNVPACPYEQVLVQLHEGRLDVDAISNIPGTDRKGIHVATQPRPSEGTLRLLTLRVGWQAGPEGSGVVESPRAEFPVDNP